MNGIKTGWAKYMNETVRTVVKAYRKIYGNKEYIPLHEPVFCGNEKQNVTECIDSTFVSSVGEYVNRFQAAVAEFCGTKFAVATVNGTAALHLALRILGLDEHDEVICPDLSFVATAAAIAYTGANPVFLDIDEDTLGLSPAKIEEFIADETIVRDGCRYNRNTGRRLRACIPVHNVGFPARIKEIMTVCDRCGITVIEDAAEALGSYAAGKMCGAFGKAGIYSFNGNKIITTGGGGMIVTDDEDFYRRALYLSTTAKVSHPYQYIHSDIGYNYRMPNINAAMGVAQMEYISKIISTKQQQFEMLKENIRDENIEILQPKYGNQNNWFVIAKIRNMQLHDFIEALGREGVMARPIWSRISMMIPYKKYQATDNENAGKICESIVCLPNGVAS